MLFVVNKGNKKPRCPHGHLKCPKSTVCVMDSVEALDLMDQSLKLLRDKKAAEPSFLDRLREQRHCHRRALRSIIGQESL